MKRPAIQGSRKYQQARYRDLVRPAVNTYCNPVSSSYAYQKEFYRKRTWGQRVTTPGDLSCLAQAARAAGRGFVYARVTGHRMYVVPLWFPL